MVKCFTGDKYLCEQALLKELPENRDCINYLESDKFDNEEYGFLFSISFLGGSKTLVFKTDTLDANETLLDALSEDINNNLYIICRKLVKNRKISNKLKVMGVITELNVTPDMVLKIFNEFGTEHAEYIAKRIGLYEKDNIIEGSAIANWHDSLSLLDDITTTAIDSIIPAFKKDNVWALKDALMNCNGKLVMELADNILVEQNSIAVLSACLIDFRNALKLSYFKGDKKKIERAKKEANIRYVPYLCEQYTTKQLNNCFERILLGIQHLKSGYSELELKSVLGYCLNELEH